MASRPMLACLLVVLAAAAAAAAGRTPTPPRHHHPSAAAVIRDCVADGDLDHVYWGGELFAALRQLPKDVRDYTVCPDVLRAAAAVGPAMTVKRGIAWLFVRCPGKAFSARLLVKGHPLGHGSRGPCKVLKAYLRIPVRGPGTRAAHRHRLARIVLTSDGLVLSFVVRLQTP